MIERVRCASQARARGEPLYATASHVRRWVFLEQAGPWGADAVLQSRLPEIAAAELTRRCRQAGARIVLLRRHGRYEQHGTRAYAAFTAERGSWLESLSLDKPTDLLDVDLAPLRNGNSVGGRPAEQPLYLVCTNGQHDACCAEYGRPLARALDQALGDRAWECSHIGGDRFAGNLLCFPHGLYYGRSEPQEGLRIVEHYERGLLELGHFRGRSAYPFVVQAGEYFVRRDTGLAHVDGLRLIGVESAGSDVTAVTFATGERDWLTAEVRVSAANEPDLLTCSALRAVRAPRYELLSLTSAEGLT